MQAIILAGGLGTRLKSVVPELPKAMAPVGGHPFLAYVLDSLCDAGFASVILALGYRSDAIRAHFGARYRGLAVAYSIESTPLGTGGAIARALAHARGPDVFVLNGDTFVELDHRAMHAAHAAAGAQLTMATHAVADAARFGTLDVHDGRVLGFFEKGRIGPGLINAGVYVLRRELLADPKLPSAFSFETDFLMPRIAALRPLAFRSDGVFIDIGVPTDYARAEAVLAAARGRRTLPR